MATTLPAPPDSLGFGRWFREFLKQELAPYPGRGATVARMVIAASITMLLIMTFRIPGGALGTLYAFLITRDNLRSTLHSGIGIAISYAIGVCYVLTAASLFADRPSLRFFWFAGSMFLIFFALRAVRDYGMATGFALILVNALPIWQTPTSAEIRVDLTLWQALAVAVGTLVTICVEVVFRTVHPTDPLFEEMDDRLSAVQEFIEDYSRNQLLSHNVANRLTQYSVIGVSGLRRTLARARDKQLYRNQLTAVVALIGRLVDLAASSSQTIRPLADQDGERLRRLAEQIAVVRNALASSKIPLLPIEAVAPSEVLLLPEMERTVALIPRVFSGSEVTDAYFPSVLDQEESTKGFLRNDASENSAYLRFAMRGCLAATTCYFIYEMLDWRGLATSVTTCVVTGLSNTGTSRQKQVLRIAGAVAGGFVLGIGSQVLILPNIDSIDQFALLFVAVTAIGAWCATASQRLSYFGIQLCLAFYLINLQEFTIQTSVAVARDRVVGIMLGLFVMWLVFDAFGTDSTAAQMVRSFTANLRAIAELALLSGDEHPDQAINQIRALRDQIGANFQDVSAQADAVPFELGKKRKEGMMDRALIRSWNPQVRTLYLMEAALLQHRVFGAESDLSPTFRAALCRFNRASASLLRQMADRLDGHAVDFNVDFDTPLSQMSHTDSAPDSVEYITSHEVEKLSHHVRDELEELSHEIAANPLRIFK